MSLKQEEKLHTLKTVEQKERRSFLKKTVYAAPTLVAMGALTKPTESEAGFGKPPSGPTWP